MEETFVKLLHGRKEMIYAICARYHENEHDKEDLFQDIVFQAWKSFGKFRGDSNFGTWLYSVAQHTAVSNSRKRRIRTLPLEENHILIPDDKEEEIEPLYDMNELISTLPPKDKMIAGLYIAGKSYEEMADNTNLTENNLRVRMNRIKKRILHAYNKDR